MKPSKLFSVVFILFCLFIFGCGQQEKADFSRYIDSYTDGVIKSASPILINLNMTPDKGYQAGSVLPEDLLKLSPKVKGTLTLKADNTLEFIPAQSWENGASYKASLNLGALCNVPKEFKEFSFQFKVIPLSMSFEPGELLIEGGRDSILNYQAQIVSSDYIAPEAIEKMLEARHEGNNLPVAWTHENNRHRFVLRNIRKSGQGTTLKLKFSKEVLQNGENDIHIPGLHEFTVLQILADQGEQPIIRIVMSEKIAQSQDLNGLIQIAGTSGINYKIQDNTITVYPDFSEKSEGEIRIQIHKGIRSYSGNVLESEVNQTIRLASEKPKVKFIGKGVIVPSGNEVLIPFSAVSLKAVDILVIQVLQQNMNFFLQENSYDNSYELKRVGRPVFQKKIDLEKDHPNIDLNRWNDFTINLANLVKLEKGVIYRVKLRFKKSYTTLECAQEGEDSDFAAEDWDNPGYYSDYNYQANYEWEERENPCHISYYNGDHFTSKNIINTSLGILAKKAVNGKYFICISDLGTAAPVSDCDVILYNYQNQKIDSVRTDKDGFAFTRPDLKAFTILAQKGGDKAYLKVADASALSVSNFDVSGQNVQKGVKGFVYGERGVWRPGDEIYLSLILEDKLQMLPSGHPIVAQLLDPKGNVIQTKKGNVNECNIHSFNFKTDANAPTGYWNAVFKLGGLTFTKTLRIETIKPNRLSINILFPNENVVGEGISTAPVKVKTQWLHGAKTPDRKAIVEVKMNSGNGQFDSYPDYVFSDKTKYFEPYNETLFDGTTDSEGNFSFDPSKIKTTNAPGLLNAVFTTRVFEASGDFSITAQSIKYSPYKEYVGIRMPESEDNWYATDKPVRLNGVTVDASGKKTGSGTVNIEVYKLDWRWWWDSEYENTGSYINQGYNKKVFEKNLPVTEGAFSTDLNISQYGRYYIQATDKSGHTSGLIAYFGSWADAGSGDVATMLNISCDKKSYKTGEKIKIRIPSSDGGVAVVSLENGKTVKDLFRVQATKGSTVIEIDATSEMCPNIYAYVTLIQPHNNRDNDRPIRLYGVININIEDPALHLTPEIKVAPELRPSEEFTVTVKEKEGKPMNYTIAVVDEGLLSLTTFRTPDPFRSFYAREALGVRTWDFYDYIYGAYGARLDKAFAVGGDEALKVSQDEKTNRFKPVVIFEGPFTLKKGESKTHRFRMPEYIGEVRTTVVAANTGQYGAASANSQVKKPLMVSVAMPRLFTPGDLIEIPVTVFALNSSIKNATVNFSTDDKISVVGNASQSVTFNGKGEQVVWFKTKIKNQTGVSTIRVEVVSGKEKAGVSEDVKIRIPNPRITKVEKKELKAGETASFNSMLEGAEPSSVLEITSIPPLNLEQHLEYLISYPHGCAEQITSKAFPQLSLDRLMKLSVSDKIRIENNVKEVISQLKNYQTADGGFAYWPGSSYISDWASTYAANFLIAAQQQGYAVPAQLLQNDLNYIKRIANNWHPSDHYSQMEQAYRLYVLALARTPDLAAMNRMKESRLTETTAQWMLASAYALCNHKEIGEKIVRNIAQEVAPYRQTGRCYGSDTRDNAVILQAMVELGMQQDAYRMLEKISNGMSSGNWYSTQETAFALNAAASYVSRFLGSQNGVNVEIKTPDGKERIVLEKTVYQQPLKIRDGKISAEIKNEGKGTLHARLINSSAPLNVVTEKIMSGLLLDIHYYDNKGRAVNISDLPQGQDITAEVSIKNTGITGEYQELVLSYLLPSGFEIINERLAGNVNAYKGAENTDIRDDRFYIYFDLAQNQTKTFKFRFNTTFPGEYILPAIQCSAMYDNSIEAVLPGGKVAIRQTE